MYLIFLKLASVHLAPHTVGPMRAAYSFVDDLLKQNDLQATARVQVKLYGSLSATVSVMRRQGCSIRFNGF